MPGGMPGDEACNVLITRLDSEWQTFGRLSQSCCLAKSANSQLRLMPFASNRHSPLLLSSRLRALAARVISQSCCAAKNATSLLCLMPVAAASALRFCCRLGSGANARVISQLRCTAKCAVSQIRLMPVAVKRPPPLLFSLALLVKVFSPCCGVLLRNGLFRIWNALQVSGFCCSRL